MKLQTFGTPNHWLYGSESGACFILGNGPSLLDIPFELINMYPSFGCNDIFLYEVVTGHPLRLKGYSNMGNTHFLDRKHLRELEHAGLMSEYCFINREVLTEYPELYDLIKSKVFSIIGSPYRETGKHGTLFSRAYFSLGPLEYVGVGYTQTYVNLQLAYAMGYETVYLAGIDHDYGTADRHFYPESYSSKDVEDRDLMDALSFRRGADAVYDLSRRVYEADGRKIYNLTTGDTTKVFDKLDYRDIL